MTSISRTPDNSGDTAPKAHPTSIADAALAYAKNDIPIVLFDATIGNGKQCGNLVGDSGNPDDRWYDHVTTDPDVIRGWLAEFGPRATGIATSPGAADAVVLDVDKPELLTCAARWLVQMNRAPFQSTDERGILRGHYWFSLPPGERFGNPAFDWGEVRCDGGGLILAPTPHARAVEGGRYQWVRQGQTPELPEVIAKALRAKNGQQNGQRDTDHQGRGGQQSVAAAITDVDAWLDAHTGNDFPHCLPQIHKRFHRLVDTGEKNVYDAMMDVLTLALKEVHAGGYPGTQASTELRADWLEAIKEHPRRTEADVDTMLLWAIPIAEADDYDKRRLIMRRSFGARHDDPTNTRTFDGWSLGGANANDAGNGEGSAGENSECSHADPMTSGPATLRLDTVKPVAMRWLWKSWLPMGKLALFEGESDVGKSTVTMSWAAIVSNGWRWPATIVDGKELISQHDPAGVLLVGVEDGYADTVVPRLIAAGGNLSRVHALNWPKDKDGKPVPFTIPDHIEWLRQGICEAEAKLAVIDPITACLPENTKHGVDADIRRILSPLAVLADETECVIVAIRHFNKATGMSAKHRGGGSVAYGALARSVIAAGKLIKPSDNGATFAIAPTIGNLGKKPKAIGYRIVDAPDVPELPEQEDKALAVSAIEWCGPFDITADDLVGADGAKVGDARKTAPMRDDAEAALKEILHRGPIKMNEAVTEAIRLADCSKATVKNAAKKMGIVRNRVYNAKGKLDHWTWELRPDVINAKTNTNASNSND